MNRTKDLTNGMPLKLILGFALPLFLGNIFQEFYNISDTVIVSHTLGETNFAAMGATTAIYSLVVGFINGMTNGFSLVIAKFFGANEEDKVRNAVFISMITGTIISVIASVLSIIYIDDILRLLKTPENIMQLSKQYIVIIFAGAFFTMLYNGLSGIMRAVGNSTAPIFFLIISAIFNVVLDILFVVIMKTGIQGAAYATVFAQIISVIFCVIYIFKKFKFLIPKKDDIKFSLKIFLNLINTGFSMGFMLSIVSIGTVILQSAINPFGAKTIAAHTAARKVSQMYMLIMSTVSTSAATFVGQNFGAGKIKRIKEGIINSIWIDTIYSIMIIILTFAAAPKIIYLLVGTNDTEIIKTASSYLYWNLPFYLILSPLLVLRSSMQGMGKSFVPLIASLMELAGKYIVVIWAAPVYGYFGVIMSEPVIWFFCSIFLISAFLLDPRIRKTFSVD